MVTALYLPESQIIQKHVEDFEGFGMVRVKDAIESIFLLAVSLSVK